MNKFLFSILCLIFSAISASAQNDAISTYFGKYAEDERFTVVYISPKMFDMIARIDTDDADWQKARTVLRDIRGLRILVASNDSIESSGGRMIAQPNRINGQSMYKDAMQTLNGRSYDELLTVRDGQQNVRIMTKEANGVVSELLLLVGEPDEFVMLSFVGKIDLDKIGSLGNALNVEGTEHLGKIKAKN